VDGPFGVYPEHGRRVEGLRTGVKPDGGLQKIDATPR
jgi:hypothetical protein